MSYNLLKIVDWWKVLCCEIFKLLCLIQLFPYFTCESFPGFFSKLYANKISITWIDKFLGNEKLFEMSVCLFEFDSFVIDLAWGMYAFEAVGLFGYFIKETIELIGDGFDLS